MFHVQERQLCLRYLKYLSIMPLGIFLVICIQQGYSANMAFAVDPRNSDIKIFFFGPYVRKCFL